MSIKSNLILLFLLLGLAFAKDPSTFSNYDQIAQKSIEGNYKIDFDTSTINGKVKILFSAVYEGEVIILDTKNLEITQIIDSNTGDILIKDTDWVLDTKSTLDSLGTPLKIYKSYNAGDDFSYVINYKTLPESEAVQWLAKEKTSGKEYPYMFTQCESILCRQLLPCQDTPNAKVTVSTSITVKNPLFALNSGIYQSKIDNGETTTYFYTQKIPIPTYLIAIAAGAIEGRKISDRTTVYAEADMVDKAASEFSDTENFIQIAETYTIPYEWGEYNILVLPPSFPFGGMENPCLTFATPSIVAGDKSLADVIAHEISHSWSGNLVTMSNWSDFWLNEGFTMFLERKIIGALFGDDMAKISAMIGEKDWKEDVYAIGESHDFTSIHPNLVGISPDDAFSTVPYEKGFNFLYYLEQLVNEATGEDFFKLILKKYFTVYKYTALSYTDFKEFFEDKVLDKLGTKAAKELFEKIDWTNWVIDSGFPEITNNFTNPLSKTVDEAITNFFNGNLPSNFKSTFQSWHTYLKCYFLKAIKDSPRGTALTQKQYDVLDKELKLHTGYNSEVTFDFFNIMLANKKLNQLEKLDQFFGTFGRMKFIKPLYVGLAKIDKAKATELFNKHKDFYHPIAIASIENELKKIN